MFDTRTVTLIINDHVLKIKADIEENMKKYRRNASNRSVKSLKVETQEDGQGHEHVILWGNSSFLVMERGRAGGRVPKSFYQIIRQWIIDKGIKVRQIPYKTDRPHKYTVKERSLNIAAGVIAYNIMKYGTRLHRDQDFDDIFTSSIEREIEQMQQDIIFVASLEVERIHQTI